MINLWEWTITIDARSLLAWALAEKVEMPKDIADLIRGITPETKTVMLEENQLAPLLAIGDAAEGSRTHHSLAARLFRESVKAAYRRKPVEFKPNTPKKMTQKSMF